MFLSSYIQDREVNPCSVPQKQCLRKRKSRTYVHVEDCASAVDYSPVLANDDAVDSPPTNVRFRGHTPSPTCNDRHPLQTVVSKFNPDVNRSVRRRL